MIIRPRDLSTTSLLYTKFLQLLTRPQTKDLKNTPTHIFLVSWRYGDALCLSPVKYATQT
uniref:Uncharacterized protein n=1 Tax=Utricularia reniformis TaxID=192314 RepID=A0A1Y0B4H7_9LAMI|nr:hypothetical protein AEK19_MT2137 [Utricularia reniformis]ART32287.1 hypothetical protein AEK19_MT2137 [Utricularia reniformis]